MKHTIAAYVTDEVLREVKRTMWEGVTDEEAMRVINDTVQDFIFSDEFLASAFYHQG